MLNEKQKISMIKGIVDLLKPYTGHDDTPFLLLLGEEVFVNGHPDIVDKERQPPGSGLF